MTPVTSALDELNRQIVACRRCPRLTAWREQVGLIKRKAYRDWDYWAKPVPGFGDPQARLWVVGLAPGAHGSNRTGRNFTGDASGDFLFQALFRAGFANQPIAFSREDGLTLHDLYISAVCRCVPPGNKPTQQELANCFPYLELEFKLLRHLQGIVVLGKVAFDTILRLYRSPDPGLSKFKFAHNRLNRSENGLPWLLASYHPSRQNTQTGRLTVEMFAEVWQQAQSLLD